MLHNDRKLASRLAAALVIVGLAGVSAAAVWRASPRAATTVAAGDGGQVVIDPKEVTLTADDAGGTQDQKVTFSIRNQGESAVNIVDVRTTCGCTVAALPQQRSLGVGEAASLDVSAHIPKFGERRVQVSVLTDSRSTPTLSATVLLKGGEPESPRLFDIPRDLDIEGIRNGTFTRSLTLIATEKADAAPWLRSIESETDWVHAAPPVVEAHPDGIPGIVRRSYTFELTGKLPDEMPASRRAPLRVTDANDGTVASFSVITRVVPAVSAIPKAVYFTPSSDSSSQTQSIVLRPIESGFPLTIEIEPSEHDWLQIEVGDVANDQQVQQVQTVKCTISPDLLPPDAASQLVQTVAHVRTNHPDCPVLEIPVYCRVGR